MNSTRKIHQSPREYDASINWDARLKRELPVFEKLFGPPGELPILDAACGNGRHAIALARRGYSVVAIDKSRDMIDYARTLRGADSHRIEWHAISFAQIARRCPGPYAGIFCVGNSLSAANSAAAAQKALANFAAVLHPRGRLFIQVLNYPRMRGAAPVILGPVNFTHDGVEHVRIRTFDMAHTSARVSNITFKRAGKWTVDIIRGRVLVFDHRQLHDWCRRAGLRVEKSWGSYAGDKLNPQTSVDCIVVARRAKRGQVQTMNLRSPPDFAFVPAVCSYGYFLLAPNRWGGRAQSYHTVLTLPDGRAWAVTIDAPKPDAVRVRIPKGRPSAADKKYLRSLVRRILRLDEDLSPFHDLCRKRASHAPAADERFGRLIRSASLFEDIVKTISTCNITWKQTVGIVAALVEHYGDPAENDTNLRGFPRPESLARARLVDLKNKCKLGYRAPYVHELARAVADGRFDLDDRSAAELPSDDLYKRLRAVKGVGDYAAGNMLMLLGHYDRVAIDSEMIRHYTTRYPRRKPTPANIRKHYAAYAPFAFLAYWYELWSAYVAIHGHPNTWPASTGTQLTGT